MTKKAWILAVSIVIVSGCSSGGQDTSQDTPKHNVFESQTRTLDKAKNVEHTIEERAKQERDAIEQSSQ